LRVSVAGCSASRRVERLELPAITCPFVRDTYSMAFTVEIGP